MPSRFLLPPHPAHKSKCKRMDLGTYEGGRWLAQRKFNGTHVVIWLHEEEIDIWDRQGNHLTLYQLDEDMKECFFSLRLEQETVFAGELLHTKAKNKVTNKQAATNTIVLFDILYYGRILSQIDQEERLKFLTVLCGEPTELEAGSSPGATKRGLVVQRCGHANLWLAEAFFDEFLFHFDECLEETKEGIDKYPEIEGLMLRLKSSSLPGKHEIGDVPWLIRCRKPKSKIYDW